MNNYKFDDTELNRKINEYNAIFNNNNDNNNINNHINNNNYNNKDRIQKVKKNNNVYNQNINNNNTNNFISYDCPSSDYINLSEIEREYDIYISNLKLKLSKEREERKKKEEEAMMIQHRLTLLKNQEQSKLVQMKKVKQNIDRIINNRKKTQEKLSEKLIEKKNLKNNINTSWARATCPDSQIKKNISCSSFSHKTNRSNNIMSNSQSHFHNSKNKNSKNNDLEKNSENSSDKRKENKKEKNPKIKNEKNSIENSDLKKRINNSELRLNSVGNKQLFKLQLIEKLKKDEEEKKMLEQEIAKIEEEEKMLLIKLGNRGVNINIENIDNNNIEEYD
jgi:hypothetical protein